MKGGIVHSPRMRCSVEAHFLRGRHRFLAEGVAAVQFVCLGLVVSVSDLWRRKKGIAGESESGFKTSGKHREGTQIVDDNAEDDEEDVFERGRRERGTVTTLTEGTMEPRRLF